MYCTVSTQSINALSSVDKATGKNSSCILEEYRPFDIVGHSKFINHGIDTRGPKTLLGGSNSVPWKHHLIVNRYVFRKLIIITS